MKNKKEEEVIKQTMNQVTREQIMRSASNIFKLIQEDAPTTRVIETPLTGKSDWWERIGKQAFHEYIECNEKVKSYLVKSGGILLSQNITQQKTIILGNFWWALLNKAIGSEQAQQLKYLYEIEEQKEEQAWLSMKNKNAQAVEKKNAKKSLPENTTTKNA